MTTLKLLSAGLVAAGLLATPALAREHHPRSRYITQDADVSAHPAAPTFYGQDCAPGLRVGAFATQLWDNDPTCAPNTYPGYQGYLNYYPAY